MNTRYQDLVSNDRMSQSHSSQSMNTKYIIKREKKTKRKNGGDDYKNINSYLNDNLNRDDEPATQINFFENSESPE